MLDYAEVCFYDRNNLFKKISDHFDVPSMIHKLKASQIVQPEE
jgi:hypothetical protein